jgi:hypothetical protein
MLVEQGRQDGLSLVGAPLSRRRAHGVEKRLVPSQRGLTLACALEGNTAPFGTDLAFEAVPDRTLAHGASPVCSGDPS